MKKYLSFLSGVLTLGISSAWPDVSSSSDYKAVHQIEVTAGAQLSGSSDYQFLAVIGGSAALGSSADYRGLAGISSGLFNVTSLNISTNPTQLPEGGTASVSGQAFLDDGSTTIVPGMELATRFSGSSGGLFLSPDGVVTAPPVYQNMNVTLFGDYAGITGSSILNILDVDKDNWGALAGDGFPDDWENRMGVATPLIKAGDSDGDGRNNALEYVLNSNPLIANSESLSQMGQISKGGWNYLTVSVRRNKAVASAASYVGKESYDLTRWVRHTDSPTTSVLDAETDLVTVTAVYPIRYLDKGFLAIDITIPNSFVPSQGGGPSGISLANNPP